MDDNYEHVKKFYRLGIRKEEYIMINYQYEGEYKKWYKNGQLMESIYYTNNNINGICHKWYKNGQLESEGNYINGIKEGKFIYYYENGKINIMANYKNNKLDGLYKAYNEDGSVKSIKNYKDGFVIEQKLKEQCEYVSKQLIKNITAKDNCSICLEQLQDDLSVLLCGHIFHKNCILTLDKCPICRSN